MQHERRGMNMSFYLIPIFEKDILLEGRELKDVAKIADKQLYDFEEKRISIIYSGYILDPLDRDALKKHDELYKAYCTEKKLPTYLIATGNHNEVKEYATGRVLKSKYVAALDVREVDYNKANKYYKKEGNYDERVINFMELYDSNSIKNTFSNKVISFTEAKKLVKRKKK